MGNANASGGTKKSSKLENRFFAEVSAGGPPGDPKNPTLDAAIRVGTDQDLGKNFFYQIGVEAKPRFNTEYDDAYAVLDPLQSLDVSLIKARAGWRGIGTQSGFSVLAPYLQAGHVVRINTASDATKIADPSVFSFGAGVDWYSRNRVTVFSQLEGTSEGDAASFTTGVRLYAE